MFDLVAVMTEGDAGNGDGGILQPADPQRFHNAGIGSTVSVVILLIRFAVCVSVQSSPEKELPMNRSLLSRALFYIGATTIVL